MQPIRVEPKSRRPIRASISTVTVPSSAVMNRQPKGCSPKAASPIEITHLPSGGWAMNSGAAVSGMCCGTARMSALALSGHVPS